MKILITTDAYYPMTNGVVISTDILYNQLKLRGHDVRILTLSNEGKGYTSGDVYYLSAGSVNVYPQAKIIKPVRSKIISEIISWQPDIIHSQTEFSTMVMAKYIKRKLKIPQVHTYHTMYEDYLKYFLKGKVLKKNAMARITRILLNSFDTVIAPTEKVKSLLSSYKVSTDIIEVIPTGIDIGKFEKTVSLEERETILREYGLSSKENILVYVGRIAEEKNIEELIHLFNKALKEIPNLKFLIVGGGPYVDILKAVVTDLNLEVAVKFTGMIDSDKIYKYYKVGTIFVTASKSESQGLTYLEALASGCPVLCRWDPCIEGLIIEGTTGFTYNDGNEFMEALKKLLNNAGLRTTIEQNSIVIANKHSKENFGLKVIDTYTKAIEKKIKSKK
ncbi:MAG: glycosyltransferase family 4 protein [Clostridiaceae bacterium]|nr:glycosyltransferase family 4 protein [Clostridiaceae bacterium]